MKSKVLLALMVCSFTAAPFAFADETVGEKTHEAVQDAKRGTKKAWRNAKDSACEMVNGKMECAGKKIKNKAKNAADKVEDITD